MLNELSLCHASHVVGVDLIPNQRSEVARVLCKRFAGFNALTRANSSARTKGFVRWSSAPASNPSTRCSVRVRAVNIMIWSFNSSPPHFAADLNPAYPRQPNVKKNCVVSCTFGETQGFLAGIRHINSVCILPKRPRNEARNLSFIVDQENSHIRIYVPAVFAM